MSKKEMEEQMHKVAKERYFSKGLGKTISDACPAFVDNLPKILLDNDLNLVFVFFYFGFVILCFMYVYLFVVINFELILIFGIFIKFFWVKLIFLEFF